MSRHDVSIPERGMLIGGDLVPALDGGVLTAENPTTERIIGRFPAGGSADVDRAVAAALAASDGWRTTPWVERSALLHRYADLLVEHADEFAVLDALDSGNPVTSMRGDVLSGANEIRYFAGIAGELKGRTIPSGEDALTFTEFRPYPVVARIVPFNHPIKFIAAKVSAALAAGCAVVAKPGEQTSLSALRLGELVRDLFPPGVLNIVTGTGPECGTPLAAHPRVPRVAFTGSVPTGSRVMELGAAQIKHVTLELGGKNPMIIFPDADPVAAANGAVAAMNLARSMGQSCGSTSRVFVHREIRDEFLAGLVDRIARLIIGDPLDERTEIGPLAFRNHYTRVMDYIGKGLAEGARLETGGHRPPGWATGFFVEPTVFSGITMDMTIAREEIFGPVISVLEWDDVEDLLTQVNSLDLGLTGNVWTKDIDVAIRTARRIESGYVSINGTGKRPIGSPFGGFKKSGVGKENSLDELLSYGREQAVTITLARP